MFWDRGFYSVFAPSTKVNDTQLATSHNSCNLGRLDSRLCPPRPPPPPPGGIEFDENTGEPNIFPEQQKKYVQTKGANALLAGEFALRYGKDGIMSVGYNPGNMKTELGRHLGRMVILLLLLSVCDSRYGAFIMLYAGWSSDIDPTLNGTFVWPFGRLATLNPDLLAGMKSTEAGGNGRAQRLWNF